MLHFVRIYVSPLLPYHIPKGPYWFRALWSAAVVVAVAVVLAVGIHYIQGGAR